MKEVRFPFGTSNSLYSGSRQKLHEMRVNLGPNLTMTCEKYGRRHNMSVTLFVTRYYSCAEVGNKMSENEQIQDLFRETVSSVTYGATDC
jgi:hypothetical protein